MVSDESRIAIYRRLESFVGKTPMRKLNGLSTSTGSSVFVKEEFRNPTGSHYDRLMLALLRDGEARGEYIPGVSHLLDATSGNSGAALAWLCRALGYECTIVIPADMPKARISQIRGYGANVRYSPAGEYVGGAIRQVVAELRASIRAHSKLTLVNHASNLDAVPGAAANLGREMAGDLKIMGVEGVDYLIMALGNGSTLGLIEGLRDNYEPIVIGFDPAENPWNFVARYGTRHLISETQFTVNHGLLGTGPGETSFEWPLLTRNLHLIDEIRTVRRADWNAELTTMSDIEGLHCGRTTAAAYFIARQVATERKGARILFIAYDPAWKYLW